MIITGINPILDLFIIMGQVGWVLGVCMAVGFGLYLVLGFINTILEFAIGAMGE